MPFLLTQTDEDSTNDEWVLWKGCVISVKKSEFTHVEGLLRAQKIDRKYIYRVYKQVLDKNLFVTRKVKKFVKVKELSLRHASFWYFHFRLFHLTIFFDMWKSEIWDFQLKIREIVKLNGTFSSLIIFLLNSSVLNLLGHPVEVARFISYLWHPDVGNAVCNLESNSQNSL